MAEEASQNPFPQKGEGEGPRGGVDGGAEDRRECRKSLDNFSSGEKSWKVTKLEQTRSKSGTSFLCTPATARASNTFFSPLGKEARKKSSEISDPVKARGSGR